MMDGCAALLFALLALSYRAGVDVLAGAAPANETNIKRQPAASLSQCEWLD